MVTNVRANFLVASPVTGGTPNVRAPLVIAAPVTGGNPNIRATLAVAQPVTGGEPRIRAAFAVVQVVVPVPEEGPVATDVFPTLIGLTFDVKKKPEFSTNVPESVNFRETAISYTPFPRWNFSLTYDYLPDGSQWSSSPDARTLAGFFGRQKGRFGAWLFHDPDDFHVVAGDIATADGVTLQWPFLAEIFGFPAEPVGQIDLSTVLTFAAADVNTGTEAVHVAGHGLASGDGPFFVSNPGALPTPLVALTSYWAIAVDADHFQFASSKANALSATPINLTVAGSGTNTLTKGVAVYDNGALQGPAAYTIALPNQLVFASAPTAAHLITADFDYYFVCRFLEDMAEFNKFMDKLWELQKMEFRSFPQ